MKAPMKKGRQAMVKHEGKMAKGKTAAPAKTDKIKSARKERLKDAPL